MAAPTTGPIGLQLARTAKTVSRAFDDALAGGGGSLPLWLVLVSLKGRVHGAQRHLAEAVGVEGPTLTHHLNRMEAAGLVTRRRDQGWSRGGVPRGLHDLGVPRRAHELGPADDARHWRTLPPPRGPGEDRHHAGRALGRQSVPRHRNRPLPRGVRWTRRSVSADG